MSGAGWKVVRRVAFGCVVALVIGTLAGPARAGVGTVLVNDVVFPGVGCPFEPVTGIAVMAGGKINKPTIPTVIATLCTEFPEGPPVGKLAFIQVDEDEGFFATVVQSPINTSFTPSLGWGAMTLRPDKGDLMACGTVPVGETANKTVIYAIDFSPFNADADGTATFLRDGPAGSNCDGIAWDAATDTIYQTSNAGPVLRYPATGTSTLTPVPTSCPDTTVGGVAVAGTSLFASCPAAESRTIDQLDKNDTVAPGNIVRTIEPDYFGFSPNAGTLAYDPVTYGQQNKDALWFIDRDFNTLWAVEIPGGTGGQRTGRPVLFPAACDQTTGETPDADGDGILDCWEDGGNWSDGLPGISRDGTYTPGRDPAHATMGRVLTLCVDANGNGNFGAASSAERATECARPNRKDLFIENDFMQFHQPNATAVAQIVAAFAAAPVANPAPTPDGIRLHMLINEQIPHTDRIALVPCTPPAGPGEVDFDTIKATWFGASAAERANAAAMNARRLVYRYLLWAHNLSGLGTTSGCAEVHGDDAIVSLGSYTQVSGHGVGSVDQQAGTAMHEIGHKLGLRHGGGDNTNCKPNYLSVMSYPFQFSTPVTGRPLDYSRSQLPTLDETNLSEPAGVSPVAGRKTAFGPAGGLVKPTVTATDGAINWNKNAVSTDSGVVRDINAFTTASGGCPPSPGDMTLEGFDDWQNLKYNFRGSTDFAEGVHFTIDPVKAGGTLDITLEEAREMGVAEIDVKPGDPFNHLNSNSSQTVDVAILGSAELDVSMIDPATLMFESTGPAGWSLPVKQNKGGKLQCSVRDVNRDGHADLVCKFDTPKGVPAAGETEARIDGLTFGGETIQGTDGIQVK